jgi:hypothetical protein
MSRGPLPKKAIDLAQAAGAARGIVRDVDEVRESRHDFVVFGQGCTVFVRVKRIQAHVADPQEIAKRFGEDILQLKRVPQTPVVSREIWVLSPWGRWQFFRITDDGITEICRDGLPLNPGTSVNVVSPVSTLFENADAPIHEVNENAVPQPGVAVTDRLLPDVAPAFTHPATTPGTSIPPPVAGRMSAVPPVTPGRAPFLGDLMP